MGRDPSVLSRQLQKLAEAAPVLEKQNGRWQINKMGRTINNWTRESQFAQNKILAEAQSLRLAATSEFASRVLAPQLPKLLGDHKELSISIISSEDGVEELLLNGKADIGFDCARPRDPLLRFQGVNEESFLVVAAPCFLKGKICEGKEDLLKLPHLKYNRSSASDMLQLSFEVPHVLATFNDIASIRAACCAGLGWAALPYYTVQHELSTGSLVEVQGWEIPSMKYNVIWLRGRPSVEPWIERCTNWLKDQRLSHNPQL